MTALLTGAAVSCGQCSTPIAAEFWNREEGTRCLVCGSKVTAILFPAVARPPGGSLPDALSLEGEAHCFYHPQSQAAIPCEECGRFLCKLCDLEIASRHLCPGCFQAGVRTRKLANLETRRTMYDSIALALATFPALLFWPAIFTAPASLFVVIRRWRAPGSLVPRTRVRFYLAGLFALAEIVGMGFVVWAILQVQGGGRRR